MPIPLLEMISGSAGEEKLLLSELMPQLELCLIIDKDAEITAYEGEGGAWIIVEGVNLYKEYHTRSR